MAFCAKCGKLLPDSSAYCGNCGAKNPNFTEETEGIKETATADISIENTVNTANTVNTEATEAAEEVETAEAVTETADGNIDTPEASEEAAPVTPEFVPYPVKVEFEAPAEKPQKKGSAWWIILGLFFPLIGLILFLIWRKKNPKSAKFVGIGALIGGIIEIIAYMICLFMIVIMAIVMNSLEYSSPDAVGPMTDFVISYIFR